MDCTNKKCPAYAKCLATYRGSRCKATRATYSLGDPITNGDRHRSMSDEELADELLEWFACFMAVEWSRDMILDWLKQECADDL